MRCPACQAETRPGVKFCEQCGTRLETVCAACGARLAAGARFCGECGAAVTPPPPATTPAADAAAVGATPALSAGGTEEAAATSLPRFASPHAYTPAHLARRILGARAALTGERKQVTVLFADVAGFTSLSEQLDPEDVHGLINRAFELMLAEVHRYEGTVNQFLGDGLMALFGAPLAHEDHAQRAAHAALAMQQVLATYRDEVRRARGIDFRVRMGLNTGLVVVGAIGDNLRMDYTAVGDTTNTAARMQQLAEPGQVVLAEATERLVAPYFELQALGTFTVRNRAQPVGAWALVRSRPDTTRLAARAARGLSPLVGRDDALATLERAWAAARAGRGQVVFVVGDAGIGKSRLLLEFRARLGNTVTWVEADCVSFGRSVPFLPVIGMLKHNFGIEDHHDEAEVIARIGLGVAFLGANAAQVEPYLRYLLAVDPGDPAVVSLDAAQRRSRVVAAIQRLTAAGSARRPVALVVEDAHWIDSASEDVLKTLADAVPGMAVLLVVTSRPTYEQPFGDRAYHWRVPLQPLDEQDAVRIVRATLDADLPDPVATAIAARAEGNPFFLEEIGHALVESGALRPDGDRLVLAADAAAITVPATVQDVIAARLDRLEETQKRTVQTAAVIGREFALSLLRHVSDAQEGLEQSLAELNRMELIYEKAGFGDREYIFRHALTQDVAYASLLVSERRRLHALIGRAIEEVHAARLEERTEELVHHFMRGEDWPRVLRYAREAAERAAALCADDKAVEFYEAALQALRHVPETPDSARAGVEIRLALRVPLWRGGEPERLFALFKEAEELARRHAFVDALDTINTFLLQYHWAKGEQETALEYGRACLERARARDDPGLRVTALFYTAHACIAQGRFAEGLAQAREVIDFLEGPRAPERFGLSGLPYSGACEQAAECLVELGDEAGALRMLDRGQRVADAAGHLYSQIVIAQMRGYVLSESGRAAEAIALLEATEATCAEKRFIGQHINAFRRLGRAYVLAGRPAEALRVVARSIELQERARVTVTRSSQHLTLAEAHLALGDLSAAEAELARTLELAERLGERGTEGWARLLEAELAAARGDRAVGAAALDAAQEIAEELGMMRLLERCRQRLRAL